MIVHVTIKDWHYKFSDLFYEPSWSLKFIKKVGRISEPSEVRTSLKLEGSNSFTAMARYK